MDTNRREISFDLDYANYFNKVDQTSTILSKDANDQLMNEAQSVGNQNRELNIYSAKVDYSQPLNKRFFMETGLKPSYVNSKSDNTFFNKTNTQLIYDSIRSNYFIYSENINAAYLTIKSEFEKISFQPVIRLEQTVVDGEQLLTNQKMERAYINLFPSISVSYKARKKNEWNINLTGRINRPLYQLLDPFRVLTDVGTYTQGNPSLKPETTYSNELSYSFQNIFFATLCYSFTLDRISPALIHDASNEIRLRTFINLDYLHFYNLDMTYSKKVTSWWNTNSTLTPFYQRYSTNNNGYIIYNRETFSFWFNTNNSFYLTNGFSVECGFSYEYKNSAGLSIIKPLYDVSAGIKRVLFKERGALTINLSDIFLTKYRRGTASFGAADAILISNFAGHWDSRILNATFSYRFGNKKAGKVRRASGLDDEKSKINVK